MKLRRYTSVLILALVSSLVTLAQEAVTVTVAPIQYVLPPHLGKYLETPDKYFTLTLQNNTDQTQNVYMGMQIDQISPQPDMHVITPPARQPDKPISIAPHDSRMLSPTEMQSMFNHLAITDVSSSGDAKNGLLPEGTYEANLTAYLWNPTLTSPVPVSNPLNGRCTFRICYLASAPRFTYPTVSIGSAINGDWDSDIQSLSLSLLSKQDPTFIWTPPINNCGLALSTIEYTLTIKEVAPGRTAIEAMESAGYVYQRTVSTSQCRIPDEYIKRMSTDATYVAQVVASNNDKEGQLNFSTFVAGGKSEVKLFRLTDLSPDLLPDPDEDDFGILFGRSSQLDSASVDSLYKFRNPTITAPTFYEGATRKIFINDDLIVEWRDVWHLGGEGMKADKLKFEYEVQVFNGKQEADLKKALSGTPFYSNRLKGNKDTIKWEKLKDHVEKGDYLVLRVKPICTNEKSIEYTGDDLNVKDFAIVEHIYPTLMNCDEGDGISNTTPTELSADELKGKTVGIGQFELTLGDDIKGSGKDGFTGTGHVEWRPLDRSLNIAVKFENLKINTDNIVFSGTAKSYPADDMTDEEVVETLFSEWGIDNLISDTGIPYADGLQSQANDGARSLAKELNISNYYTYYKFGKGSINTIRNAPVDDIRLPIAIDDLYNDSPVDIQLADMTFTPSYAVTNLIGEFSMPDCDITDNEVLIFGAPFLCITPDRLLPETGNLCLLADFNLKDKSSGYNCKFIAPKDLRQPTEGCYVSWISDAFKGLQLHVEMEIPHLQKEEDGKATDKLPVLTLKANISDWDDWVAAGSMDAFQVKDLPGYTFQPGTVIVDHSEKQNAYGYGFSLPKNYDFGKAGIKDIEEFQGLYMQNLYVAIPDFIESSSSNGKVTNEEDGTESEVSVEQGRIKFTLNHLIYDQNKDFTCKASLNTSEVLKAETNKLGGWSISLDEIYVDVLQSQMGNTGFRGKFSVPLLKDNSKDNKGKRAYIAYNAYMASADKAAGKTYIFKTSQEVDLSLDFFLAEAVFDKEQTYFFVEKPEDKDTRVELCLGGKVDLSTKLIDNIDDGVASALDFFIPDVEFSCMRLANCERWKSEVDKNQAAQYNNWVKKWGNSSDRGSTEMNNSNESGNIYFDIGKWSFASPKKKMGGLDFNITSFDLNTDEFSDNKVGLDIGGDLSMLDGALAFGTTISIKAKVNWEKEEIKYAGVDFQEAHIKSKLGGINIEGKLVVESGSTHKGYKGDLKFELPGGLFSFQAAGAFVEAEKPKDVQDKERAKRWASMQKEDGMAVRADGSTISDASQIEIDEKYTYAFLEIAVNSDALSSIQPVSITGLRGGFYMNCRKKDLNTDFSADNVVESYGMIGGMIGLDMSCCGENAITAGGQLTVLYDLYNKRLSTIRVRADVHAILGSNKKKGLINTEATITYLCNEEQKYFDVDITLDANADMDDMMQEFIGSESFEELKKVSQTGLNSISAEEEDDHESNKNKDSESKDNAEKAKNHLKAGLTVNFNFRITWMDNSVKYDKPKWHIYVGKPQEDERCRMTYIDFSLGKRSDKFAMWATIYADAYLCFGNELPVSELPEIPQEISEFLGLKQKNVDAGDDLNSKAEANRTKVFSEFQGRGNNGGVMFGGKYYGDIGLNAGLIYFRSTAILGGDLMIQKLKDGTHCIGGGEAGRNGWYGTGQLYAMYKGELGLDIDLWIFSGKISLISVGLGALLKAGLPNPTWVFGKAKAHYRLLGGLIKGSATVQFKAGQVCTPEFANPLDDIQIFGDVTPGEEDKSAGWRDDNAVSCNVYPQFNTNMEMGSVIPLLDENKAYEMADFDEDITKYADKASRWYRFMLLPDTIRLACYDVNQANAKTPKAIYDEKITYNTRDQKLFNINSGSLEIGKLYKLTLSGMAQEYRNGKWVDPVFNDKSTNYKDKNVHWYQTQTYYFRTSDVPPSFKEDIAIFHTTYRQDILRPTFALKRSRWGLDKFDDPDAPISLRIEVAKKNGPWETPDQVLDNLQSDHGYYDDYQKWQEMRDACYQDQYDQWYQENKDALSGFFLVPTTYEDYCDYHDLIPQYRLPEIPKVDIIIEGERFKEIGDDLAAAVEVKGIFDDKTSLVNGYNLTQTDVKIEGVGLDNEFKAIGNTLLSESNALTGTTLQTGTSTGRAMSSVKASTVSNVDKTVSTTVNIQATEAATRGAVQGIKVSGPAPDDIIEWVSDTVVTRPTRTQVTTTRTNASTTSESASTTLSAAQATARDTSTTTNTSATTEDTSTALTHIRQKSVTDESTGEEVVYRERSKSFTEEVEKATSDQGTDLSGLQPFKRSTTDGEEDIVLVQDEPDKPRFVGFVRSDDDDEGELKLAYDPSHTIVDHSGQDYRVVYDSSTKSYYRVYGDYDKYLAAPKFTFDGTMCPSLDEEPQRDAYATKSWETQCYNVELEEVKVDDDYIFLRTKKELPSNIFNVVTYGYKYVRISLNRIHKKRYDEFLENVDKLVEMQRTRKAELAEATMGDADMSDFSFEDETGNDAQDVTKDPISQYIDEMVNSALEDSISVQQLKRATSISDFSERIYETIQLIPEPEFYSFKNYYNDNPYKSRANNFEYARLSSITQDNPPQSASDIVNKKAYRNNPYFYIGYVGNWAMLGGITLKANSQLLRGLDVQFTGSGIRRGKRTTFNGLLASSASDASIYKLYDDMTLGNTDDVYRAGFSGGYNSSYGGASSNISGLTQCEEYIRRILSYDCATAASLHDAIYTVAHIGNYTKPVDIYNKLWKTYDGVYANYTINDKFANGAYYDGNKFSFPYRQVFLMIFADIKGSDLQQYLVSQANLGWLYSPNGDKLGSSPNLPWRVANVDLSHAVATEGVTSDSWGNNGTLSRGMNPADFGKGFKKLNYQVYRQNSFHTARNYGGADNSYDICTKKDAKGLWYVPQDIINVQRDFIYLPPGNISSDDGYGMGLQNNVDK